MENLLRKNQTESVEAWIIENVNESICRDKGGFWSIYNSKTSAAWGWNEAQKVNGLRIVWLCRSPVGNHPYSVIYDYITEEAFLAGIQEANHESNQ